MDAADQSPPPPTESIQAVQSEETGSSQNAENEAIESKSSIVNTSSSNTSEKFNDSEEVEDTEQANKPPETSKNPLENPKEDEIEKQSQAASSSETADKTVESADVFKKPQLPSVTTKTAETDFGDYAEHVTYEQDGTAIYTDPKTKYQYKWSEKEERWTPLPIDNKNSSGEENPFENEHYKWCSETQSWKPKATQVTETEHYKWDAAQNAWIPKQSANDRSDGITYDVDEDGNRIYTDKDGAIYFWDDEKNAWFPKIDDDFMARYQMNYGFIDNVSAGEEEKRLKAAEEAKRKADELQRMAEEAREAMDETNAGATGVKRKATQEPPKWFEIDAAHNTKVYVSNLPLDITLDEFAELMGKCGMIMRDPQTQKYKLKLYTEADGQIKGDGLCDYIKVESVNLALSILDEYVYRGHKIRVQRAKFEMRGAYNPALKPKRKKKDKEKLQKMKERLFDWRPEKMRGERTKNEKIVIIKNLFTPDIFEKEVQLILDYQNDLREECSKCGTVRKVVIYDCHAEGVAQINMSSPEEADLVIQMMNGRYFGKRQLSADHWDGKTKYKVAESEKEVQERLTNWDQFLEADAEKVDESTC